MEDWERKRTEERITRLETELRELKSKLILDEDKRKHERWMEDDRRKFRQGLIPMVAAFVLFLAVSTYAIVSKAIG